MTLALAVDAGRPLRAPALLADLVDQEFVERNAGAITILVLCFLVLVTLLILVPQLLRWHQRSLEMQHLERMRTLEQGEIPAAYDQRSYAASRIALLVPMVVICAAATVTCFMVVYKTDNLFAISLAVWCVAGVIALAAITAGVALLGRLAQFDSGIGDEESLEQPIEK
jgi:hypothetical protein